MKKFIILISCLFLIACAGFNIKPADNIITAIQASAVSTVGYLIIKNNPEYADSMLEWYSYFKTEKDLADVQIAFEDGMNKLSELISDDPYLQLQVRNAMNLLEIKYEGPQTGLELGKYKAIVDAFMSGVMAGKLSIL